ncbi:MAG: FtsX-like permease family protein [Armatimonadota bacterium]
MSSGRLLLRSLVFYWRTGIVVVFGLAVATAVITGSLVIGDSVNGSLRDTGLSRLGRIDYALVAPGYFREELATDLMQREPVSEAVAQILPLVLSHGAARHPETGAIVPNVKVVGIDAGFWELYDLEQAPQLSGRECAVNAALASDLGLREEDALLVTAHRQRAVASDSLFARRRRQDIAPSLRLLVKSILPQGGVGDFRLDPSSSTPRNVFVSRQWLAARLGTAGLANVLAVASHPQARQQAAGALSAGLAEACTLRDHGLKVVPNTDRAYVSLFSDGMLLTEPQILAGRQAAHDCGAQAGVASVYLATRIRNAGATAGRELAYAVICGLEPLEPLDVGDGAQDMTEGDWLWLNTWAAQDLRPQIGDALEVSYLVPTRDGTYPTARTTLRLERIVELDGFAADPGLVPDFEGITDADQIHDWDPPFPLDLDRVTERDEEYWEIHRATPKAFVSLETVRAMWQSAPAGAGADWVTSLRVAAPSGTNPTALAGSFTAALLRRILPGHSGLHFSPVRELALEAARGTSDFGQLFLGLSMFLVLSGAGLAGMLLRLSVDRRAPETGIMLACGCEMKLARRGLLAEGAVLSVLGTLLGVPAGLLYAAGIIGALGNWWSGAMGATSTLWLHVTAGSLATGGVSGLVVGLATTAWSTRRLGRRPVLDLLAGSQAMAVSPTRPRPARAAVLLSALVAAAAVLGVLSVWVRAIPPQAAFFGIGCALLLSGLAGSSLILQRTLGSSGASRSLPRLSLRNAAASSGRSLLVIGLVASASFIIVAVAANTRDFSRTDSSRKESGTGGFALRATSSVPLPFDPATPAGRANLGFTPEDEAVLEGAEVISFLANRGEDISCLNLARPTSPRLLGVPQAMIERGGFSVIARADEAGGSAWELLRAPTTDDAIPVFGDAASVRWTLHSGLGKTYAMPGPDGRLIALRFEGLLPGSIFARELLVSEHSFRRLFPSITAPSYFLIDVPPGREDQVAEVLRRNLGELGLQVRTTREVLNEFIAVQNTYLSMFLALGGLGLVLGTVGLVAVLLRSALERRREMALMLATGFDRPRLAHLLLVENGGLLLAGLLAGTASALVAVSPHLASAESRVNWTALSAVLAGILAAGLATCATAAYGVVRANLVPALRQE